MSFYVDRGFAMGGIPSKCLKDSVCQVTSKSDQCRGPNSLGVKQWSATQDTTQLNPANDAVATHESVILFFHFENTVTHYENINFKYAILLNVISKWRNAATVTNHVLNLT